MWCVVNRAEHLGTDEGACVRAEGRDVVELVCYIAYQILVLTSRDNTLQADHLADLVTTQCPRVTMLLTERSSKADMDCKEWLRRRQAA
jgi:hypothetical protein